MDLNAMTVTDLKAAVYDQMVIAEQTQKNIQILNQAIASKAATPAAPADAPKEVSDVAA